MDGRTEQGSLDEVGQLLLRCSAADAGAFRRLYELRSARLYGLALRITGEPALAADAVHDAMLQVWRNAGRFDPGRGSAEGWLLALVRYRALDLARRGGRERPGAEPPDEPDPGPDSLARLSAARDGQALRRCLADVAPERRRLVLMAFVQGLTHPELAARTGQPLGTVKSSIRRALASLRACLEPLGVTAP